MDVRRVAGWVLVVVAGPAFALLVVSFALAIAGAVDALSVWRLALAISQAMIVLAIPAALLLIGWRLARGIPPGGSTGPSPAPVAVPDADATDEVAVMVQVDGAFTCCPRCGYLGIHAPTLRDGLWPGGGETSARMVCGRCHYQGLPLEFDDADQYAAFVKELNVADHTQ